MEVQEYRRLEVQEYRKYRKYRKFTDDYDWTKFIIEGKRKSCYGPDDVFGGGLGLHKWTLAGVLSISLAA